MNLKIFFDGVLELLLGLYFIVGGIRIYKQNIIISHTSEKERINLVWTIGFLIDFTFMEKYKVDYYGLIIGTIPITIFAVYLIYSRLNDVKYRIYNVDEDMYEDIIKHTLEQNGMEYSISYDALVVKGTCMYIELINKGFLLKRCKKVPNYQKFLNDLESNLKNAASNKKKKDMIASILIGIIFIAFSIMPRLLILMSH